MRVAIKMPRGALIVGHSKQNDVRYVGSAMLNRLPYKSVTSPIGRLKLVASDQGLVAIL